MTRSFKSTAPFLSLVSLTLASESRVDLFGGKHCRGRTQVSVGPSGTWVGMAELSNLLLTAHPLRSIRILEPGDCRTLYIGDKKLWSTGDEDTIRLGDCITNGLTRLADGSVADWEDGRKYVVSDIIDALKGDLPERPVVRWSDCAPVGESPNESLPNTGEGISQTDETQQDVVEEQNKEPEQQPEQQPKQRERRTRRRKMLFEDTDERQKEAKPF